MVTQHVAPQATPQVASQTDSNLLETAIRYGTQARLWRNKFLGLLPEINRRKLYEQRGFSSIFEFAFKTGGVSEEQVKTVIRTEDSLRDKPQLHNLLVSGEVSINKMVRIHSIATKENDELLANQVQILSKSSLETLVKDIKNYNTSENISFMPGHETAPTHESISTRISAQSTQFASISPTPNLDEPTRKRLTDLQNKGIDINALINNLLDQREREIEEEKEKIVQDYGNNIVRDPGDIHRTNKPPSRYIPIRIRRLLAKEHGTKCSIRNCSRPSREIHHERRFALDGSHDPRYLAQLCKQHHQIAHAIDVKAVQKRIERQNKQPRDLQTKTKL